MIVKKVGFWTENEENSVETGRELVVAVLLVLLREARKSAKLASEAGGIAAFEALKKSEEGFDAAVVVGTK